MVNYVPEARVRSNRIRTTLTLGGLATVLALAACGGVGTPVDTEKDTAADADVTFRFAHVYDAQHPVETCGVPAIKEALDGTGMAIESYPSGQLGSEAESLEQVASGGLDIAIAGPSFLGIWYEDAAVLDGAYLFRDVDHFTETVAGPEIAEIHEKLFDESGIKVLSTWYYGTRHVTSNKPINTPGDLAGVKIRTPDAPLYLKNIKFMGGTATPMALGEVYTGLQQGSLDAQENPIPTIASSGFQEVQDYINLTGHMVQAVHVTTGPAILDKLDESQLETFNDALTAGGDATKECIVTQEEEILDEWRESGVIEINDNVEKEVFADAVAEGLPSEVPWGDLYLKIQATQ